MRNFLMIIITFTTCLLIGCGASPNAKQDLDYDQTKKMVIDILQTDEGKKALQDVISDDKMKQHLVMDSDVVKEAITEALISEEGTKMWEKLFADPSFVETFVKSTSEGQKELFKELMVDADFQKKLIELMQNPELVNQTLTLLKSQQFREHLEKTIQETIESPLFQAKIEKTLLEASEKKKKESEKESSDKKQE